MTQEFLHDRHDDDFSAPQKSRSNQHFHARPSSDRDSRDAAPSRRTTSYSDGTLDGDAWVKSLEAPSALKEESDSADAVAQPSDKEIAPEEAVQAKALPNADLPAAEKEAAPETSAKTSPQEIAPAENATVEKALPESQSQAKQDSEADSGVQNSVAHMGEAQGEFEVLKAEALAAADGRQAIGDSKLLEQMQASLQQAWENGPKPAFVYIHLLPEGVEMVLVPPEGDPIHEVMRVEDTVNDEAIVGAEGLIQEAGKMRVHMTITWREYIMEKFLKSTQFLYDSLIAPLDEQLKKLDIEHMQLVMDNRLQHLPMSALQDKKKGYLIERFSIAYSSSFEQTEIDRTQRDYGNAEITALGEGDFSAHPENWIDLPGVEREVETVNALDGTLPENQTLNEENLRQAIDRAVKTLGDEEAVRELLSEHDYTDDEIEFVLHLGTHGEVSRLLTADGEIKIEVLEDIDFEGVELLILSACNTSSGGPEQPYGLAGVALKRGANTAIASMYHINDAGTEQLAILLHHQLREQGLGAAEALQHAQVAMLNGKIDKKGNFRYKVRGKKFKIPAEEIKGLDASLFDGTIDHPFYWASLRTIGDWQ